MTLHTLNGARSTKVMQACAMAMDARAAAYADSGLGHTMAATSKYTAKGPSCG